MYTFKDFMISFGIFELLVIGLVCYCGHLKTNNEINNNENTVIEDTIKNNTNDIKANYDAQVNDVKTIYEDHINILNNKIINDNETISNMQNSLTQKDELIDGLQQ